MAFMVWSAVIERRAEEEAARLEIRRLAQLQASALARPVEAARHVLTFIAWGPAVRDHAGPASSRRLGEIAKDAPVYANLGAAKPDGEVWRGLL